MNIDLAQILLDGVFAAIASIGFAIISNPPKRAIFVSAFLAAVGHAFRFYLMKYTSLDIVSATFFSAFTIGWLSIFFAKKIHCPAEVFSFPSLLPMIPGLFAYKVILYSVKFMQSTDQSESYQLMADIFRNASTSIGIMFAMAIGVSLPLFIFYDQSFKMTRLVKIERKFKK